MENDERGQEQGGGACPDTVPDADWFAAHPAPPEGQPIGVGQAWGSEQGKRDALAVAVPNMEEVPRGALFGAAYLIGSEGPVVGGVMVGPFVTVEAAMRYLAVMPCPDGVISAAIMPVLPSPPGWEE